MTETIILSILAALPVLCLLGILAFVCDEAFGWSDDGRPRE